MSEVRQSVSNKQLMNQALDIAPKVNVPDTFKASCMHVAETLEMTNRVSKRCDTNDSQKLPANYWDVLHSLKAKIIQQRVKYNIAPAHVFNMSEPNHVSF